jgi:hypothetical protein
VCPRHAGHRGGQPPWPHRRPLGSCFALRLSDLESTSAPLFGQTLVPPWATTLPDRTVFPGETPPPGRPRTDSASDPGSVTCSFPIMPAWVGETVVTAGTIPMATPKIRVLMHMLMALLALLVESARCERSDACRLPPTPPPATGGMPSTLWQIRMRGRSRHDACVPGTWKKIVDRWKVVGRVPRFRSS